MGVEHARAAKALGVEPTLLVRSTERAESIAAETGLTVLAATGTDWIARHEAPTHAVVAVAVDGLAPVCHDLIRAGVKNILVEKPGGTSEDELARLADAATAAGVKVFIGYNRRFYASVQEARRRLAEDGGATSVRFDFTELAWRVAELPTADAIKAAWLYANSTHVIDTAFFLAGEPEALTASVAGELAWHPAGAVFAGQGRTGAGALFSYLADWNAPGRWSVDVRSPKERLLLEPLEGLSVQRARTFTWEPVDLDTSSDGGLKPGVLGQMRAFLGGDAQGDLMPLAAQVERARLVYDRILGQ